jgi:hypothetical protein
MKTGDPIVFVVDDDPSMREALVWCSAVDHGQGRVQPLGETPSCHQQ